MYLHTRRDKKEYRQTTGHKRARGLRTEFLPCRCNHNHSDLDNEVLQNSEIDYSIAAEEPSKVFDKGLTKRTSSHNGQSVQMKQRRKLEVQDSNLVN